MHALCIVPHTTLSKCDTRDQSALAPNYQTHAETIPTQTIAHLTINTHVYTRICMYAQPHASIDAYNVRCVYLGLPLVSPSHHNRQTKTPEKNEKWTFGVVFPSATSVSPLKLGCTFISTHMHTLSSYKFIPCLCAHHAKCSHKSNGKHSLNHRPNSLTMARNHALLE